MIVWCDKPELKITSDVEPHTCVRQPLPSDTEEEKKDKRQFPYLNKRRIMWDINYLGTQYCFVIEKGFKWDGATCLGLHHLPKLLTASCVHDKLCNDHSLVGNDRQLSTIVFREIGIKSGVNKQFMWIAYHVVDNFQKVFGRDLKGNKWLNKN